MVAPWKIKEVEELKKLLDSYNVVGVFDLRNLPSAQMQEIRKKLKGKAKIKVARVNLIKRAMEGKDLPFHEFFKTPIGIIVSNEDPFKLFRIIKASRSKAYAKPGMIAPNDIVVPAGPTDIPPGPELSRFKAAGVKTKIEGGKIVVVEDTVVAKKGEVISEEVASLLQKLDIKPVEIGLNILRLYDKRDGIAYDASILDINEEEYFNKFVSGVQSALSLSFNIGYPTSHSIQLFISKAFTNALSLALETNIINKRTIEHILAKHASIAKALLGMLKEKGYTQEG